MYSHGSSARAGVGKRGHGGREYRPPRKKRDPNATPPPLKECGCLCQLHLPEYLTTALTRVHASFGGRENLQHMEKYMRLQFLVHLVVPGRKQAGPVAVVGQTYHKALPAVAYLLQHLQIPERSGIVPGRIQRKVQDPNDNTFEGSWHLMQNQDNDSQQARPLQVVRIFESHQWNVVSCLMREGVTTDDEGTSSAMVALQVTIDNFCFQQGNGRGLDIFVHDKLFMALAAGDPPSTNILFNEVGKAL